MEKNSKMAVRKSRFIEHIPPLTLGEKLANKRKHAKERTHDVFWHTRHNLLKAAIKTKPTSKKAVRQARLHLLNRKQQAGRALTRRFERMYASIVHRHRSVNKKIRQSLLDMALDVRGFPGARGGSPPDAVDYPSSASAPSLRARESEVVTMGRNTPDQTGGNVKVVVRVRGFLPREVDRNAECLVKMDPVMQSTTLLVPTQKDPANARTQTRKIMEDKSFTFDNSFDSFDAAAPHYATQETIYNTLGEGFLDHNFEGYHTCIFAYGQTGSGKSYTMMGTQKQPGLIPRTCQDLFERIGANDSRSVSYDVRVSYFEVYNEHVRDLLAFPLPGTPGLPHHPKPVYCKIRESPTEGPYVKDLVELPVKNYEDLLRTMHLGDRNRTTAATKMNDTSSRSHAVFTILLKQLHHDFAADVTTERVARIRLVDLAGSERAGRTEATGARLREGANINKSLTTLGRVIAALADPPQGRKPPSAASNVTPGKTIRGGAKDVVPYRDSILTWLLKDSLGGNSKTAMIACVAPADYDETLSTLRYADQAKRIRTRAIVNQDSVSAAERDAQIEDLQRQIRELQVQVSQANDKPAVAAAGEHAASKHPARGAAAAAAAGTSAEHAAGTDKLEQYQQHVGRMQKMMEEDKLVAENKLRQLTEQNETLRRHLHLCIDRLKNPLPRPLPSMGSIEDDEAALCELTAGVVNGGAGAPGSRSASGARGLEAGAPPPKRVSLAGRASGVNGALPTAEEARGQENCLPAAAAAAADGGLAAAPDASDGHDPEDVAALREAQRRAEASLTEDALETSRMAEELLRDLAVWRRKLDDDKRRFCLLETTRAGASSFR